MFRFVKVSIKAISIAVIILLPAQAQFMDFSHLAYNTMAFDQQFDAQLGAMVSANQQQMLQLFQSVASDPQVQAGYQQYIQQTGQQLPYEHYVYYYIMTAGGTNVQAGLQAQQNMFNGIQQANATVQSGFDSFNQGWWQNQAVIDQTMQNYTDIAVNGNGYYTNPDNGSGYTLPYTSGPGYYQMGQDTFYLDNLGQYWQLQGNQWVQMNPVNP